MKDHGGEQGLEPGKMQLQKDYDATHEAINGWWKDSQSGLEKRMNWYKEGMFGCFIHWGPYSDLESKWNNTLYEGYGEHIMRMAKIPVKTYKDEVIKNFNPELFDADEWMAQVAKTGMKYFVITAKHHDGFAMWPSDVYKPSADFPSYDETVPAFDIRLTKFKNRDPIMELREAAKKYDIKFGLYYSHAFDWEHPFAPGNDWDDFSSIHNFTAGSNPGGDNLFGSREWWLDDVYKNFDKVADNYVVNKARPQIKELMEKYKPDLMWFDTPHKLPLYQNIGFAKLVRETGNELGIEVVINGRLAHWSDFNLGDYINTGDRAAFFFPVKNEYWETIPTTNESYGYSAADNSHKQPSHFIRMLGIVASKGGSVLMNVGPMGNGKWDPRDIDIFNAIGEWMYKNGESVSGTTRTNDIPIPNWGAVTKKDNKLYLHVHQWPSNGILWLGSLEADIQSAAFHVCGSPIKWAQQGKDIKLDVGLNCPDAASTVIVLTLNGSYKTYPQRLLDPLTVNELLAFDAILTGDFSRGDGKPGKNQLENWISNDQFISWNVSLREKKDFDFQLQYNGSGNPGIVSIEVRDSGGNMNCAFDISYNADNTIGVMSPAEKVLLPAGDYRINLKGKLLNNEYLRPMMLRLTPHVAFK